MQLFSKFRLKYWFSRLLGFNSNDRLEQYRRIFRGANDYGYFDWHLTEDEIVWSGGYWRTLGYSDTDVTHISGTKNYASYTHPEDLDILMSAVRQVLRDGGPIQVSYRVRKKRGGWVWTEIHADATRDENGWVHYISGIALDITRRKQAEQALLLSEARHARIIKASNDGFWEWTAEQGGFSFSSRCWELLGYTEQDDIVNQGVDRLQAWRNLMHPEDGKNFDAVLERHIKYQEPFDVEYRIRHRDGSWCWVRGRGYMTFDKNGVPSRMSGTNMCITPLKLAEERVLAAKEQAESANRAKSDFLSSMSHELRTPLNAILGFSHLLETDPSLGTKQRSHVTEIVKAGRYLLTLIGDVLDLAKIESGRLAMNLEPVSPALLIKESLNYVQASANELSLRVTMNLIDGEGLLIEADKTRLKQVLLNLMSNAVKYNKPYGQLMVSSQVVREGVLRVNVEDTGVGITEAKQHELFQPFCRLGAEQSNIEGSGVGLVITRQLVDQMGGSIGYEPRKDGGSCFWLELPIIKNGSLAPAGPSPSHTIELIHNGPKKVLYIEDNEANQRLIGLLFDRYKEINVQIASDAFKGVFAARISQPDLIMLDINLPGMNGFEALEILKSDPLTQHTPIIALSANAMTHDREKGLNAGFDAYLTKPLDMALLIETLNRLWLLPNMQPAIDYDQPAVNDVATSQKSSYSSTVTTLDLAINSAKSDKTLDEKTQEPQQLTELQEG